MTENRLTGLVARKGEAPRPTEPPSRSPGPSPARPSDPVPAKRLSKALTVKLSTSDYERLRRYAFERRTTHQDVIEKAVLHWIDRNR